jgi:hypothetical protein
MHYRFHVNLFARPERLSVAAHDSRPQTCGAYFPFTFEEAIAALAKLPRLDAEPDGFFVLAGCQGPTHWHVSGQLFDFAGRVHRVELHGECPVESFDALLACLDWPRTPLAFELVREGVALDEVAFRAWASRADAC